MLCPKCNGLCRLKMKGAICLDCNWSTHNIEHFRFTLNGDMAQQFNEQEYEEDNEDEEY
jgi:hypothetical protein